jgi:PIN domain nuclease of toxin-antitoxin system
MDYLLDTVTLVRYLSNTGKLTKKVKTIFADTDKGDCKLFVSTISFMEILYLSERNRIPVSLEEVVEKVRLSTIYEIIDLSTEIVIEAKTIEFDELHDRLILATAKYLDIPVISSDSKFREVDGIDVIW